MLRALCGCRNERKVDVCSGCGGKLLLRLLSGFLQSLHCHLIAGQIHAFLCLEFADHPFHDALIKIITAKACITIGGKNLDDTVADLDDGNIEGTAAKVINHDLLFLLVVQTICQCSCRRLVDDTLYIQSCDLSCILGCLTLCIIEICRNRNDCLADLLAQIALCIVLQLLKNHCGNLLRAVFLAIECTSVVRTHVSLNRRNGVLRIGNSLALRRLTDQTVSVLRESYYGRSRSRTFLVCNNGRLTTFHDCNAAIGCS